MLVSCPSCQKQYHFPPEAYKAPKVRCTACQHVWSPMLQNRSETVGEGPSPLSRPIVFGAHAVEKENHPFFRYLRLKLDWMLLGVGILVGGCFLYQERNMFAKFFPAETTEEKSYKTETALVIQDVFYRFDKGRIIVAGEVTNPTANVLETSPLFFLIRSRRDKEQIYKTWGYRFEATKILPSERIFFETEIVVEETFTPDEYQVYVQFA